MTGVLNPDRSGSYSGATVYLIDPKTWGILEAISLPVITIPTVSLQASIYFNT